MQHISQRCNRPAVAEAEERCSCTGCGGSWKGRRRTSEGGKEEKREQDKAREEKKGSRRRIEHLVEAAASHVVGHDISPVPLILHFKVEHGREGS